MISLKTITVIALYEAKALFRSWFFRIFLLVSLVILILVNVGLFVIPISSRWMYYGIPSSIPYLNILLFGIVQAIIGIFMASDFLKYDYKLDTTEVIYIRSMTNADYIFGKVLGILTVFFGLNLLVLFIAFIFNFFFADAGLAAETYFLYPVLLNLPSLIFITGLTFFLMIIIRSQAVTFILLLGYSAISLLFLSNKLNHIFDFIGYNLPVLYSDFIGFGNLSEILTHRGIYFLLGSAFIFASVLLLRRLPQSKIMNLISFILLIVCLIATIILGTGYISKIYDGKEYRAKIMELKKQLSSTPLVSINTCTIDLKHLEKEIEVKAGINFTNKTNEAINSLLFSLNPGLKVVKITSDGKDIKYSRNMHTLTIQPDSPLKPGQSESLTIEYRGKINENACYPQIDEAVREDDNKLFLYNIGKRYSFITPECLLLTPENNWYPKSGANGGNIHSGADEMDFIKFSLNVKTDEKLTAVSQGKAEVINNGIFSFTPEYRLPCISLFIGKYEKKSIRVDEVEYILYYKNGHDYFTKYFDKIGDSLEELIQTRKADFESKLEISYPYKRLSLIEVPVKFFTYPQLQSQSMETTQPEQILLPEKGVTLLASDFRSFSYFFSRMRRRRGGDVTPEDMQSMLLGRFIDETILNPGSQSMSRMIGRMLGGSPVSSAVVSLTVGNNSIDYSIFPLYYTYARHLSSQRWPMFNMVMEHYLTGKVEDPRSIFRGFFTGLSEQDEANLSLIQYSLDEILENPDKVDNVSEIIKLKSTFLFSLIKSKIEEDRFESFMKEYLNSILFTDEQVEEYLAKFEEKFGARLEEYFDFWMREKKLPAFTISNLEGYEILDNNKTKYQVMFNITNLEEADGIVKVEFRTRGGGSDAPGGRRRMGMGRMPFEPEGEKFIALSGKQSKKIGIIMDSQPFMMAINTLVSQNIPSVITKNLESLERNETLKPFDGEITLDKPAAEAKLGVVIVDNEDEGFIVDSEESQSFLLKHLDVSKNDKDAYIGMRFRNLPSEWKATVGGDYYGTYRLSAHYIKAGSGKYKVSWTAKIPRSGSYDVYYYVSGFRRMFRGRPDRGGNRESMAQDFHFTIHHDDGGDEITIDLSNAENGWFLLGSFYFSEGTAKVELSDKSRGRIVYADAVRWTERE